MFRATVTTTRYWDARITASAFYKVHYSTLVSRRACRLIMVFAGSQLTTEIPTESAVSALGMMSGKDKAGCRFLVGQGKPPEYYYHVQPLRCDVRSSYSNGSAWPVPAPPKWGLLLSLEHGGQPSLERAVY
jgi:hypothetical protein